MAKIIKKAEAVKKNFTIGQTVDWNTLSTDGRLTWNSAHRGKIIKVCPVNLHVVDTEGNTWSVSKEEVKLKK